MNERIVEIASQAGYDPEVFELCRAGMEKFARLIVKECAAISKDHQRIYYDSHGDRIAKKIEEHFGVEV